MLDKLLKMRDRYAEIEKELSKPEIISDQTKMKILGREYSKLGKLMPTMDEYESVVKHIEEDKEIIKTEDDDDLRKMAIAELDELVEKEERLRLILLDGLIPPDPNEGRNIIVEIRAGTGGDEAALFAGDLFRMYTRLAERQGWKMEIIGLSETNMNGYKEVIFVLSGETAYTSMRFEGGVHRVQRVPKTEASGRLHTSAASVMIFPEVEKTEIDIPENEIRIDYYASSGCGGQHVNRTYSAVRIVHEPTGIIATCQDEKSQHKNRDKAMRVLMARLMQRQEEEQEKEMASSRKSQVRSGDRSEKIRTYNFPQNRITDHRISYTAYNLTEFLDGDMDAMLEALQEAEIKEILKDIST